MLHMYALYLLAQFRERAAYPLVVKLFSAPGDLDPIKGPIEDTVSEMRGWAYIRETRKVAKPAPTFVPHTPIQSVKVGRNDPCPCGGKKYKKCCLQ